MTIQWMGIALVDNMLSPPIDNMGLHQRHMFYKHQNKNTITLLLDK
jgi:hypothetical protein